MAQAVGRRRRTCHLVKTPRGSPVPTLKTTTLKSQNYVILPRVQRERVIEPRSDQAQCDILETVAPDMGSCSRAGLDTGTPVECRCEGSRGTHLDWTGGSRAKGVLLRREGSARMAPSQQEDPPGNIGLRVVRSRRRAGAKPEGSKPKGESSHEEGH